VSHGVNIARARPQQGVTERERQRMEEHNAVPGLGKLIPEEDLLRQEVERLRELLRVQNQRVSFLDAELREMVENEDIDADTAERLADVFGITLTKTVTGTVTVTWTFEAEVELNEGVDDLDFTAELVDKGNKVVNVNEDEFDVTED
jgi:plasmid maintenance system antidote protein VapI